MAARDRGVSRPTGVVILAAGEGTRMRSSRPKPLHQLCGRAMVLYVLDAAAQENVRATVVVVGHSATWVEKEISERARGNVRLTFVEQSEQLGTGHAVSAALPSVEDAIGATDGDVLILPGDTPLLRHATVARLLAVHRERNAALTVLSARMDDPTGYGRLVYAKDGSVERIVEERDANVEERGINEVNTSIMVVRQSLLGPALRRVGRQNSQHEYYLTDLVAVLHEMGHVTSSLLLDDASEVAGVNDRLQLARAERVLRQRINDQWLARGVTMWNPAETYVDADVELAAEVSLLPGTILKGHCVIARGAQIGPNAYLSDVEVGENAYLGTVEASRVRVGADARVSSFVVLSPGTDVASGEIVTPFTHRSH
jgi:bifunctional UDP-N-acetylglucosamine pyrophosphorylase/glucosamine-1-phosphate N-acetyltransferase